MVEEALDASSLTVLQIRLSYIHQVESARNPNKADAQLRTMVERRREVHGKFDGRYAEATLALAAFLHYHGRYIEAAAAAEEVIRCGREGRSLYATQLWCQGMAMLACSHYQAYDDKQAESTLRQAIDVAISNWGWEHGLTLHLLTALGTWLTQFKKYEEAAEVSEQVTEILRQSNAFV
jgi:tetratricopeptide (TPR) repeat protein